MTRGAFLVVLSIGIAAVGMRVLPEAAAPGGQVSSQVAAAAATDDATRYAGVVKQYCAGCHNGRASTSATASGVVFDTIDLRNVAH